MNRRDFTKMSASAAAFVAVSPVVGLSAKKKSMAKIPLGAPVFEKYEDPAGWINALDKLDYRAAYSPVSIDDDESTIKAYAEAARKAGVIISEVGAWSNPGPFLAGPTYAGGLWVPGQSTSNRQDRRTSNGDPEKSSGSRSPRHYRATCVSDGLFGRDTGAVPSPPPAKHTV